MARDLTTQALEARTKTGVMPNIEYDVTETRRRHEVVRDAFAALEAFSTRESQGPARDCMEALSRCVNGAFNLDIVEAQAGFAFYEQRFEVYSVEENNELEHFNALLYSWITPLWRAVLLKARRKPPPYKSISSFIEPQDRKEGVRIIG
jgi:hypothetical protein